MSDNDEDRLARFTWQESDIELGYSGLVNVFKTANSARDKYLSRLFGLFSEDVVRDWCAWKRSRYIDLGRPPLFAPGEIRGLTLDFALQSPASDGIYVAEMKAELEFESYRYLTLERVDQLDHHRSPAFRRFLELTADPSSYAVRIKGKDARVVGTVLVWGAMTPEGRSAVMGHYGFADVLSIDDLIIDLQSWGDETPWPARIERLRGWSKELFRRACEQAQSALGTETMSREVPTVQGQLLRLRSAGLGLD